MITTVQVITTRARIDLNSSHCSRSRLLMLSDDVGIATPEVSTKPKLKRTNRC